MHARRMRWSELPDVCHQRLLDPGVVLVATIRPDGTPRLSPVEPYVHDDANLYLAMLWRSHKAADLLRDPRVLVHSVVTNRDGADGEVKLRGIARPVEDERVCEGIERDLGWRPDPGRHHLFVVDIESVAFVCYAANGDQHVTLWPEQREFVRRATGATSVGDPEPA